MEKKTYPHVYVYNDEDEPAEEEMNLYFVDGGDIPYAALSEYIPFLVRLINSVKECDLPMSITYMEEDGSFSVMRTDNYSVLIINPELDTMTVPC